MHMRMALLVLSVAAAGPVVAAAFAQRSIVAPTAGDIRGFQLTREHLRGFVDVTRAMDRLPSRGPEAPRADVAMFTVLSMSLSFNEPFTDRTVPDAVRTIERGHPELATGR